MKILRTKFGDVVKEPKNIFTKSEILDLRKDFDNIHVSEKLFSLVSSLVSNLRKNTSIFWGPSPRASISLINSARVLAMLDGRDYVVPGDVMKYASMVLNHRMGLNPEYELEGVTTVDIVNKALDGVDAV